jgi:hypothetical protein
VLVGVGRFEHGRLTEFEWWGMACYFRRVYRLGIMK